MITKEKLQSIKVLFRAPNGGLYGIPYEMRKDCGQQPRDIWRAHHEYEPPRPGWYGSKQVDISDWIWLGWDGGYHGGLDIPDVELVREYLKPLKELDAIPLYSGEWTSLTYFGIPTFPPSTKMYHGEDMEGEPEDVEYDPMDRVGLDPEPEND